MTKDEVNFVSGAKIGQPIPTEDTFDANDDVFEEGKYQFEKQFAVGLDRTFRTLNGNHADIFYSLMGP
jgi:hypothetical protein